MVDGDERLAGREGDRLAGHRPDQKAADEARPRGRGDRVEVVDGQAGARQRLGDDAVEHRDVGAAAISGTTPP